MNDATSRRGFVAASATTLSGAWLAFHLPAIRAAAIYARRAVASGLPFEVLTPAEAAELDAVAARIIPTDDTPGAREAGVISFVDRALGTFAAQMLAPIRAGLSDLQQAAHNRHAGIASFAALAPTEQDAVLKDMEQTPFFGAMRFLTVAGTFADPSYGANKDEIGWKLLGFEGAHAYQAPFGYYDRVYGEQGR